MNGKKNRITDIIFITLLSSSAVLLFVLKDNIRFRPSVFYVLFAFIITLLTVFLVSIIFHRRKTAGIILSVFLSVMIFTSLSIYSFSSSVIFFPHFDSESYEALKTDAKAEEITISDGENIISGWFYNNAGEDAPVILYYYGNGENASTRLLDISKHKLQYIKSCNFAVFDYPGYGLSTGRPDEKSLRHFALKVYDEISKRSKDIIIHGYSIGTGPAVYTASERNPSGLVLFAPYANGQDLYNNFLNIFYGPIKKLISFDFPNDKYAENINIPVTVFASENDKMVSFKSSCRLSEKFPQGEFIKVNNISHDEFWNSKEILENYARYIDERRASVEQ